MSPRRRKKHANYPVIYQWPTLLILAVITLFAVNGAWEVYKKADRAHDERDKAHAQLQELQEQKASLKTDIEALQSQRGIDAQVRKKYGVVKEGEEVVVIVDGQQGSGQNDADNTSQSWWDELTSWFEF